MVGLVSPVAAQASSDAVLILHFDEGSGTVAKDESGYGNDGTIYGATWTTGISGKALSFDGMDDHVDLPDVGSYLSEEFTYVLWVKVRSFPYDGILLTKSEHRRDVRLGASEGYTWFQQHEGNVVKAPALDENKWYHLAAGWDGSQLFIYINGELEGTASVSGSPDFSGGSWWIGGDARLNRYSDTTIDEIAIYNRTLPPEEIQAHYLSKRAGGSVNGSASNLIEDEKSQFDWTGTWDTDWGETKLVQTGDQVTGTYEHDNGKIVGVVAGYILTGTWSEAPSYNSPNDAGDVELTISSDCNSFTGNWRYGSTGDWDGDWTGSRVGLMADDAYETQQHVESVQSEIDEAKSVSPEVSEAKNKFNEEKSSGMLIFIVMFAMVGLFVLAYFIIKKSDGRGKKKDVREAGAIKSHSPNKEKQEEESGVLEDEDIAYETFCANCGVKITKKIFDKGKQLDSDTIICDGCYRTNQDFGGGCPVCKSDFSLFANVSSQSVTGNLTVVCKKCGAIFDFKSDSIFSIKWKLIEGNSEYLNVALPEDDWKRIRNEEMPKSGVCPGCNYGVDVIWKDGWDAECKHCGRKLRIESNQLVEVVPDEIASIPMHKVILHSKSVIWPPCCSICLGPADEFKDRVDNFSTELIVYYSSKTLKLPSVPYCSNCYRKIKKLFRSEPEGISISKKSDPDKGIIIIKFRNLQYAKMFRELNGC
jgi:transcription elongation factor Elf1